MVKPQGTMSLNRFEHVADRVKECGIKIGAMFCCGEPFLDPTLFDKYAYARKIGVLPSYVGLNTNVSLLTEEKWPQLLEHTDNIILSFVNVGEWFEHLTGLSWKLCYKNATDFIKHRDLTRPDYRIIIGCNLVDGSDTRKVKEAFKDYRVEWAVDEAWKWHGVGKPHTGTVRRSVMYPHWKCDGHTGRLELKWNGNCEICSWDIVTGETCFANIFEHSWKEIECRFKERWRQEFELCKRCDYYHLYHRVKGAGFKYVDDRLWQYPYLGNDEKPYP